MRARSAGAGLRRKVSTRPEQKHDHAAEDRCIGEVEGGPVRLADLEVEKVCHAAQLQPVHDIPERAAKDEPLARGIAHPFGTEGKERDPSDDDQSERHQRECGYVDQHAEADAGVATKDDVEAGNMEDRQKGR